MCTFISLIVASQDLEGLNASLAARNGRAGGRSAERVAQGSLASVLRPGEVHYWLVKPPCDCGSFVGSARKDVAREERAGAAKLQTYRRKGWSEAKIARALTAQSLAAGRHAKRGLIDDAVYWISLLSDAGEALGVTRLGLMHHMYRHAPGSEIFVPGRIDAGPLSCAAQVLAGMADGVIHDFLCDRPQP